MFKNKDDDFVYGHELSEDAAAIDYAWSEWVAYPKYEVAELEGTRFIYVDREDESGAWFTKRRLYRPLSRQYAALFLEFAQWPEEHGMEMKHLASAKNENAALAWAESYGLLGLTLSNPFTIWSKGDDVIHHHLGVHRSIRPRTRNEAVGGPEDSIEAFAREAWIANITLRLYEAAGKPDDPDMDVLEAYMPDFRFADIPGEYDLLAGNPTRAKDWALRVTSEIVEAKVRGCVWPLPVQDGSGVGYSRGWGFSSLLGAMWLQMLWFVSGKAKRCEWCGKLLDIELEHAKLIAQESPENVRKSSRKPRSDRRFCRNNGICRAAWNYHDGGGSSNKKARKMKRENGES